MRRMTAVDYVIGVLMGAGVSLIVWQYILPIPAESALARDVEYTVGPDLDTAVEELRRKFREQP